MKNTTSKIQLDLAESIRNPERAHEFEPRRMAIYRELFFNNIEGFCATTFPVLKSTMKSSEWTALVRQFFIEHRCSTPHFIEISEEFLAYLSKKPELLPYPWALELAHYEWVELACSVASQSDDECFYNDGDAFVLDECLFSVAESAWPLAYQYPVHTVSADNAEEITADTTQIIVYREADDNIKFLTTDLLTIHLLTHIQQAPEASVNALSQYLQSEPINMASSQAESYLNTALPQLFERRILTVKK